MNAPPTPQQLGQIENSVAGAVGRLFHLFREYNDIDFAALKQDMMAEVIAAWPKYRPELSAPGTFAYRVASCRLRDIRKSRVREGRRIAGHVLNRRDFIPVGEDDGLPYKLRGMMAQARQNFQNYGVPSRLRQRGYPPCFDRAQTVAVLWLRNRYRLSLRQISGLLADDPEIRASLGLKRSPSHHSVGRAIRAVSLFNFSKNKLRVSRAGE